jgi:CRISPR-associated protein Cas1
MTDRIIDLSSSPAKVNARNGLLVIRRNEADAQEITTPFAEVAVVIGAHRQIVYTQGALAQLAQHGVVFVACDEKSLPVGLMLPLNGHHLQAERFAQQARATLPTKKRLWQQIVRMKVTNQSRLLHALRMDDFGLAQLKETVRSGDPSNIEAQASRKYWPALFDDKQFRRKREAEDQNKLLNYGYGVLLAMVGRAICAAGLHPSLGLHHHNRYNPYCLAADLMEPYRPIVDRAVFHTVWKRGAEAPLDKESKSEIIGALIQRYSVDGEARTLFNIVALTAQSLAKVFAGEQKDLLIPEI